MIIDSLSGFEQYRGIHERFALVYDYIAKTNLLELQEGRHDIDGDRLWCSKVQTKCKGVDLKDCPLEVHDSYIDIHVLLEGAETYGFRSRRRCDGEGLEYDEAKDCTFLKELPEVFCSLTPGNMVIIFPKDAHAPLIGEGEISKVIFKVKI
ncbi:MAG: YhcH/YjgK/YiaL family protein [Bacteroidales bacterium]|nr:YhcH/YjgK/YiaL family protein [Bacteroidales bacterium]